MSRCKRVVVLGCGPAGLFAAQAATSMGYDVEIISKLRRSEMFGAQYLHTSIPGLTDDQHQFNVEYRLEGDLEEYLHKVYGATIPDPGKITKETLVGIYPAWDIRAAYHKAFDLFGRDVVNHEINLDTIIHLMGSRPALIISTIPAPSICRAPELHAFETRDIWAIGDAPERGVFAPRFSTEPNVILYDGTPYRGWYRASNIAGYYAVEWPEQNKPPISDAAVVRKPVKTTCDCWVGLRRAKFMRLGRYGAWNRAGHTHQAYWNTLKALKSL